MKYAVERASDTDRDLAAVFDFLIESYQAFGDDPDMAFERAAQRLRAIDADMRSLGNAPHQRTLRQEIRPGLRSVTKNRAVFYFHVDDDLRVVRVLAIFFGGQGHHRHMLKRLLGR